MPNFVGATRGTTTQRGYGTPHMRARAAAFTALPDHSPCARCGRTMWKYEQETLRDGRIRSALHYDHNHTRTGYLGFSHKACNTKEGAAEGGRVANERRNGRRRWRTPTRMATPPAWHSRTW